MGKRRGNERAAAVDRPEDTAAVVATSTLHLSSPDDHQGLAISWPRGAPTVQLPPRTPVSQHPQFLFQYPPVPPQITRSREGSGDAKSPRWRGPSLHFGKSFLGSPPSGQGERTGGHEFHPASHETLGEVAEHSTVPPHRARIEVQKGRSARGGSILPTPSSLPPGSSLVYVEPPRDDSSGNTAALAGTLGSRVLSPILALRLRSRNHSALPNFKGWERP